MEQNAQLLWKLPWEWNDDYTEVDIDDDGTCLEHLSQGYTVIRRIT